MKAFHNDQAVKDKYLSRVAAHAAAERLIQGTGWNGSKGCAVGCTLEAYDHSRYPIELGLPEWLARLEDSIFEGLPADQAMTWPQRFLEAIPVGAGVEDVRHKLAILRLDRLIELQTGLLGKGVDDVVNGVLSAMQQLRRCHEAEVGGTVCGISFEVARSAAESAARSAWSAESAAWSAARSAAGSAAESAARSAAGSAAESAARSAAWSAARSAAESAAWSAESAAWSAWSARSAAWQQEATDLLRLLSEATE